MSELSLPDFVPANFRNRIRINSETGCWIWIGAIDRDGYGRTKIEVEGRKRMRTASQALWICKHGPIPTGLGILHGPQCRGVRACCNPDHTYAGNTQNNADDREAFGMNCRGVGNGRAKFTADVIRWIRTVWQFQHFSLAELGRLFDVRYTTIRKIVNPKYNAWVGEEYEPCPEMWDMIA